MFNNPPGTVIREAAFCNEAVDMRVPFQRSPKCVKDTDEARNKASRLRGRGVDVPKILLVSFSEKREDNHHVISDLQRSGKICSGNGA